MNSEKAIESKEQLVEWFKLGNKNKKDWKVGTEHEKFAYNFSEQKNIFTPTDYESLNGIASFLNEISKFGWEQIIEEDNVIGLKKGQQSITLEPGGQIELSGSKCSNIHQTNEEFIQYHSCLLYTSDAADDW